jgi:ATP synthase protein I
VNLEYRKSGANINKPPVFGRMLIVWMILLGIGLSLRIVDLIEISRSMVLGVSVCFAPSVAFAWFVFRYRGASVARQAVNAFYRGESMKFVLTAILFAVVFVKVEQIHVLVFFASFIVAQLISWLVAGFTIGQRPNKF